MDISTPDALPGSLALIGVGQMGGAMLQGWLAAGLRPEVTTLLDPQPSEAVRSLCASRGIALNPALEDIAMPGVVVLATKPQSLEAAAATVDRLVGAGTLVVSILAGKSIAELRQRVPNARAVVRAMPNLPASIGRGATAAVASPEVDDAQRAIAHVLLASVGTVEWLESEDLIDAVTAISGSGPAYVFHLVETMASAGAAAGLPADLAQRLARATVIGAGALLDASDLSPAELRRSVTSPGGTTAAALEILMGAAGGLEPLMREAVAAAKRRAGELAG